MFFSLPSQICHVSRTREAGRPLRVRPTLSEPEREYRIFFEDWILT